MPFGEYVPLPRLFFFVRQISTAIGEFTPAPAPVAARVRARSRSASAICYEIIYPSLARREVADGANLLATISNDSWYGRGRGAGAALRRRASCARSRTARYLLRAAITGISGIVDSRGRILARVAGPTSGSTLTGTVRLEDRDDRLDALGLLAPGRRRRARRSPCYSSASRAAGAIAHDA